MKKKMIMNSKSTAAIALLFLSCLAVEVAPNDQHNSTPQYNVVRDPVHVIDLKATTLHCMGIDHENFSVKFQGLNQRLTGVEGHNSVGELLA